MLRLFVGLELPESIKQRLLPVQRGVTGARWQTAEQLHLTLRFIGNADETLVQATRAVLTGLPFAA
jgi:2'-5' RNA ligase